MIDKPPTPRELRRSFGIFLPYIISAGSYIGLGVWQPRFLLSWSEGILFLLFMVWALPALYRRMRRR